MIPKKVRLTQTLLEALLPILGYFYWSWDASFVLLWFGLDWVAGILLTYLKSRKRYAYSRQVQEKRLAQQRLVTVLGAFAFTLLATWFTLPQLIHNFLWKERIWAFLSYADMGIPQGVILVPLIALNGYLLYNNMFIKFRLFEHMNMRYLTKHLPLEAILTCSLSALAFSLSFVFTYPSEILLFGSILGISVFRFFLRD